MDYFDDFIDDNENDCFPNTISGRLPNLNTSEGFSMPLGHDTVQHISSLGATLQ